MKKIHLVIALLILAAMALLAGCNPNKPVKNDESLSIHETTIDGCQYYVIWDESRSLTHKGNCNNPIHKNK